MNDKFEPLVSVLTPVYNGETFIEYCILSAINQTYRNFEYIIVDNCSQDDTYHIIQEYQKRDSRIKIFRNEETCSVIKNHRIALQKISPKSKYCKFVHSDDYIYPECIEKMVDIAEKNPSVGMVSSYTILGNEVRCTGIPVNKTIVPGHEICRAAFLGEYNVFGSPTVPLFRTDYIVNNKSFLDEENVSADIEVCFEILVNSDLGFVHQVLSVLGLHKKSVTETIIKRYGTSVVAFLSIFKRYGRIYFNEKEYKDMMREKTIDYYKFLAKNIYKFRNNEFRKIHGRGLKKIGLKFKLHYLMIGYVLVGFDILMNLQYYLNRTKYYWKLLNNSK